MKKFSVCLMLSFLCMTASAFADETPIKATGYIFIFNGNQITMPSEYAVYSVNDRVYMPLRFICESAGLDVKYDPEGQVVFVTNQKKVETVPAYPPDTKKKLDDLTSEVEKLKKENKALKEDLKKQKESISSKIAEQGLNNKNNYKKVPADVEDDNMRFEIKNASFDMDGLNLRVRVTNVNSGGMAYGLKPSDCVLSLNGKEYSSSTGSSTNLYSTLNEKNDSVEDQLMFRDVEETDENKEGLYTLKIAYRDMQGYENKEMYLNFRIK